MHPLSCVQERLLFAEQVEPGAADHNVVQLYRVHGPLDDDVLTTALADVVDRHPILRTVYGWDGGAPAQLVLDWDAVRPEVVTAPAGSAIDRAHDGWWDMPFDLESAPPVRCRLVRVSPEEHVFGLNVHHIALDGWSEGLLRHDLATAYSARANGRAPSWQPVEAYHGYVAWERERLVAWANRDAPFWHDVLSDQPRPMLPLPADPCEAPSHNHAVELPSAAAGRLAAHGRAAGAPPLAILLQAVANTLGELFGHERMWLGALCSGRFDPRFHSVVGCFVNAVTVPLSANDDLAAVTRSVLGCLRHSRTPINEVFRALRADGRPLPHTQVLVALHDRISTDSVSGPIRIEQLDLQPPRTSLDLFIEAIPRDGGGWLIAARWRDDVLTRSVGRSVVEGVASRLLHGSSELQPHN